MNGSSADQTSEPRSQRLNSLFDAVGEAFAVRRPALFKLRGNTRIGPQGVPAQWGAAWVHERLLTDHEVRIGWQLTQADLPSECDQVLHTIA